MLIDHGESFYYYSLTQKRETWNRSIGWYSFHQDEVKFQQLTMDSSTRPVLVRLEEPKKTVLPSLTAPEEEGEKAVEARDEAFRDFIKETLGTGLFPAFRSQDMDLARIGRKCPLEAFACSEERFIMEIIFCKRCMCSWKGAP